MMWRPRTVIPLLAGCLSIVSCERGRSSGTPAPDFEIDLYQGGQALGEAALPLSSILAKANRPVVLNFWAAQCPPCRTEMGDFQRVWEAERDKLLVLGIDMGALTNLGTAEEALRLLAETAVTYPVGAPGSESVVRDYKLLGLPATFFLKPGGEIHRVWTGALDHAKLTELTAELLAATETR